MGLLDFLTGRSSATNAKKTLIAIDWEKAQYSDTDFSFINKYPSPVVWFFYKTVAKTERWSKIEPKHAVTPKQVPNYESRLATYLSLSVLYEVLSTGEYKRVVFISTEDHYLSTTAFLKEKGYQAEDIKLPLRDGGRNLRDRGDRGNRPDNRRNEGRNPAEGRDDRRGQGRKAEVGSEARPERRQGDLRSERTDRGERREPLPSDERDLEKILSFMMRKFPLGEQYPKGHFGMVVKQATGKTVFDVFHSHNARAFINGLIQNGCLEEVDNQTYKLVKYPELDFLESLANRTVQEAQAEDERLGVDTRPNRNRRGGRGGRGRGPRTGELRHTNATTSEPLAEEDPAAVSFDEDEPRPSHDAVDDAHSAAAAEEL